MAKPVVNDAGVLDDAVAVRAALVEVDAAIAHLAASPMGVEAAAQMRAVLDGPGLRKARTALARLERLPAPRTHRRVRELAAGASRRPPTLMVVAGGAG